MTDDTHDVDADASPAEPTGLRQSFAMAAEGVRAIWRANPLARVGLTLLATLAVLGVVVNVLRLLL